jgi:hypothetical protein
VSSDKAVNMGNESKEEEIGYTPGVWTHITMTFNKKSGLVVFYLNSVPIYQGKGEFRLAKDSLELGSPEMQGEYT